VSTSDDQAVAVGHRVEPARWRAEADKLLDRMAGRFVRVETRYRARGFLFGLLADLPRKNCWSIAEHAGDRDPHGMQHLLNRAVWDTDGVRDDLRDYVITGLGDTDAVLVVDETGDFKKGVCTVGVQRQYTGTAGRIENAQVAVYLTYAGPRGHAMIDRELYLPKSWTSDDQRCTAAGVPEDIGFLTKPALTAGMLIRAQNAGIPARWVTGAEVYGADPTRRAELEYRRVGYVLGIGCDRRVPTEAGLLRADEIAAALPKRAWQRLSAGPGAKGQAGKGLAGSTLTGPPLDLLATLDPAGDARARTARGDRRPRTQPAARARLPDRAHLQRDPPPVGQLRHRTQPSADLPTGMVTLATTPPTPSPHQPLPTPIRRSTVKVTIYGWSTSYCLYRCSRLKTLPSWALIATKDNAIPAASHQFMAGARTCTH
jgi:hypothetical protein